jgi:recombinational DNA repair protein (RecF pathway)
MSYKTYTTEGLVCGSHASNTSDKSYLIFTKDAGMLFAHARSVREERSKQRYALQDFSHIRVSLLKGKNGWRIGSVESLGNPFLAAEDRGERARVTFIFSQLRRYVHGEVPLPRVFDDTLCALKEKDLLWEQVQRVFEVRLLSELGYISPSPEWFPLVEATTLRDSSILYRDEMKESVERAIRGAAEASHL